MNHRKILFLVVIAAALVFGVQPAQAQCGVDVMCIVILVGSTAQDIAEQVEDNWNLPDFACASSVVNGQIFVTISGKARTIRYVVPAGSTLQQHEYELRFALPLSVGSPPFDMFVNFDNQGEQQIPDGLTTLGEIQ